MDTQLYSLPPQYSPAGSRYDGAPYTRCGQSGVRMSPLSLGFWHNFGGVDSYEKGRAVARAAFDAGITCFDLANNYGPPYGSAEENFGRMMKQDFKPYRDELFIASKAGYDMWPGPYGVGGSRKYLLASLDQSLKRMRLDYVDVFYHHCMDPDTPLEETVRALAQAVHSGKALYVGLSNYSTERAEQAIGLLREEGAPCLIEQSAFNMLQRQPEEEGLLAALQTEGVGFAAYSPLAQGLLSGKYNNGIPEDSRAAGYSKFLEKDRLDAATLDKVAKLAKLAEARGLTMSQLALRWLLDRPGVTTVVIGASRVAQLLENNKAAQAAPLSEEEQRRVEAILKG